jgi:hypothetical protein
MKRRKILRRQSDPSILSYSIIQCYEADSPLQYRTHTVIILTYSHILDSYSLPRRGSSFDGRMDVPQYKTGSDLRLRFSDLAFDSASLAKLVCLGTQPIARQNSLGCNL